MSPTGRVLIVTVFGRNAHQGPPTNLSKTDSQITQALQSLIPDSHPTFLEIKLLAPAIRRLTYNLQSPPSTIHHLRHEPPFTHLERTTPCEIVLDLLPPSLLSSPRFKLAIFDMDSTLINEEVIDELARTIDLLPAVSAITTRAMNGEIDFSTSLLERVALLKGVRADIWSTLKTFGAITIATGALELISSLKAMGVKTAVVSGGFMPMACWLKDQLGLDYAFANHLLTAEAREEVPYEHLSGLVDLEKGVVDAEAKRRVLLRLAGEEGVDVSETIAVGDGSNDLLMMGAAGLGVAWRAKAKVQEKAPARLNGESLEELLWLFGDRDGGAAAEEDGYVS